MRLLTVLKKVIELGAEVVAELSFEISEEPVGVGGATIVFGFVCEHGCYGTT